MYVKRILGTGSIQLYHAPIQTHSSSKHTHRTCYRFKTPSTFISLAITVTFNFIALFCWKYKKKKKKEKNYKRK